MYMACLRKELVCAKGDRCCRAPLHKLVFKFNIKDRFSIADYRADCCINARNSYLLLQDVTGVTRSICATTLHQYKFL